MVAYNFLDSFKVLIGEHLNQKSWIVNEEKCVMIMGEYLIGSKGEGVDHSVKRRVNSLCCVVFWECTRFISSLTVTIVCWRFWESLC